MPRSTLPIALLLTAGLCAGCGAGDADAPAYDPGQTTCPALSDQAPILLNHIREGRLTGTRDVLAVEVTDGQISAALDGLLRLIRGLSIEEIEKLGGLIGHGDLSALSPQLASLVGLITGDPAVPASFRVDVLDETAFLLNTCDGQVLFDALQSLSDAPELPVLLKNLGGSLDLSAVQELLSGVNGSLNRDGFNALIGNILLSMTDPDFDFSSDVLEPIRGLGVIDLDTPPLSVLLDAVAGMLGPDRPVVPAVADLICCSFYGEPRCAAVNARTPLRDSPPILRSFLYDLFIAQALPLEDLFGALGNVAGNVDISAAVEPLGPIIDQISADPDLREALVALIVTLLKEENARRMLPEVKMLLETGAVDELLAIVTSIASGCEP